MWNKDGAAFLLVQLRELRRDVVRNAALLLLDAVAVFIVGELILRQDVDLRAGAGNVARHNELLDAVLNVRLFTQTVGGVGGLDGLAVGGDTSCSSPSFVLLFFVQNLFIISVFLAGDLLIVLRAEDDRDLRAHRRDPCQISHIPIPSELISCNNNFCDAIKWWIRLDFIREINHIIRFYCFAGLNCNIAILYYNIRLKLIPD